MYVCMYVCMYVYMGIHILHRHTARLDSLKARSKYGTSITRVLNMAPVLEAEREAMATCMYVCVYVRMYACMS